MQRNRDAIVRPPIGRFMTGHRNDYGHQMSRWRFFLNRYASGWPQGIIVARAMMEFTKSEAA